MIRSTLVYIRLQFRYEIPYRTGSLSQLHMFPGNRTQQLYNNGALSTSFSKHLHILFIVTTNRSIQKDTALCLPQARAGILAKWNLLFYGPNRINFYHTHLLRIVAVQSVKRLEGHRNFGLRISIEFVDLLRGFPLI